VTELQASIIYLKRCQSGSGLNPKLRELSSTPSCSLRLRSLLACPSRPLRERALTHGFATGDTGDAGEDGREYAQDAANHLSKILRIDPTTASMTVVGIGVRNVQRLFVNPNNGDPRLEFVDRRGSVF
jgi:hypothetical protein